jgi:hypothetical protein
MNLHNGDADWRLLVTLIGWFAVIDGTLGRGAAIHRDVRRLHRPAGFLVGWPSSYSPSAFS